MNEVNAVEQLVIRHDQTIAQLIKVMNENVATNNNNFANAFKSINKTKKRSKSAYIFAGISLGIAFYEYKKIKELESRVAALAKEKEDDLDGHQQHD